MRLIENISVWGEPEEGAISQIKNCALTAERVALMADNHKGYAVPIGGVVAYKDAISPSGVGFDIACGNKAVQLDIPGSELRARISTIMDDIWRTISFGVGRKNVERVDHPSLPPALTRAGTRKQRSLLSGRRKSNSVPSGVEIATSICSTMSRTGCGSACTSALGSRPRNRDLVSKSRWSEGRNGR